MPVQCDFCSAPDQVACYRAKEFGITSSEQVFPDTPVYNIGGLDHVATDDIHPIRGFGTMAHPLWLACSQCSAFIDARNLDGLLEHCVTRSQREGMLPTNLPPQNIRHFYRDFFSAFFHYLQAREPYAK